MLQTHKIPFYMTLSIQELIDENSHWHSVILHIHNHLLEIKKSTRTNYFSVWTVECDDAGQSRIYCQEDTGCERLFVGCLPFKLPSQKFYLCLNELGGYTLMLPEDY